MPDQQARREGAPAIDYQALERDLRALRIEHEAGIDHRDYEHLRKMERWGRLCTLGGYATAWIAPNPLSAFLISLGNTARWTIVTHHVSHRSMDRVPGVPERYRSKVFARGKRRFADWLDWILPEAWHHEHDVLHHFYTCEIEDPDLVEETAVDLRDPSLPLPLRYLAVGLYACTWKLVYYAPSTFRALKRARDASAEGSSQDGKVRLFNPFHAEGREFWRRCVLPYATFRFAAVPALFLPLGPIAVANVLANSVAAEVLTNLHSFLIIVPSHAASDLYRFEGRAMGRAERYLRQIVGSSNYATGGDLNDFFHGFLNYQIEHHLFPELPPLKLREIQPRVKALCEKHGLPYVQESVFRRAAKLVDILVGKTSMRRMDTRTAQTPRTRTRAAAPAT